MFGYFPTLRSHHAQLCFGGVTGGELRVRMHTAESEGAIA